jgi:gamma-glutamyltranspeptidase/glutathione hydrolase
VVDRDRMAVSLINSLYHPFGSAVATEETGIMLHSRGACFVVDPGHPNAVGPRKRPMHTIIPALAMRDGRCELSFGVMGAHYQPMGHVQVLLNMVDYGMDVQAAIDVPRAFFEGDQTLVERGMPAATVEGLKARGHAVDFQPSPWGGGQIVRIDWERGVLLGGSDHRKDGCALGY